MKLIGVFTPSHERLKDEWLLRSLKDDYDTSLHRCDVRGSGAYMEADWTRAVVFKADRIIEAIQENWNDVFVYSDVDVVFFAPTKPAVLTSLADQDIVCQLDDPWGNLCTGFFGIRANAATLRLWRNVRDCITREGRDQVAFNRLVRAQGDLRAGYLPRSFFGPGTFAGRRLHGGQRFHVPPDAVMFHANWTKGVENKIELLSRAERLVAAGGWRRPANNLAVGVRQGRRLRQAGRVLRRRGHVQRSARAELQATAAVPARPRQVALDASTVCQLKCPSCPTANGTIARSLGAGFLTLARFEEFLDRHPSVADIELSNWGEVFLNKELEQILRHAHQRGVALRIDNGANLDRASPPVLEALVRYEVRGLTCSIDGASPAVYSIYRVNGRFERVIEHIRQINAFKRQYRSDYPALRWQFVAFGHNTHEIARARAMAAELGMEFYLKLSWDDLYTDTFSPVEDRELVRAESVAGVADRAEYERKFGRSYISASCHQLWLRPRINFDGRLLGCSINHWADFGNVFTSGLDALLASDKVRRTKEMLLGLGPAEDSPCLRCAVYQSMKAHDAWVTPEALGRPAKHGATRGLRGRISAAVRRVAAPVSRRLGR
ncbi:MAG TPA: putative nucleotide-diphospho-sugar transferase [Methylomirabilota bacterium]|jgi:MoaA/NifB/PqqE/SkfB family radical SAM enzyme